MRRIAIVGNSGGGKSTLARRLGARLGLPVVHLDILFWKPGWVESDETDFRQRTAEALAGAAWICDGNFGGTFDIRFPRADTIIWIDQLRWLCVWRAMTRVVTGRVRSRPDMAEGCRETVDFKFYGYILDFDRLHRPMLEAAIAEHGAHARLVRLRSDRDIADFLAQA